MNVFLRSAQWLMLLVGLLLLPSWPAQAMSQSFGPFTIDDAIPGLISLDGDIDAGAALNFRRALEAAPNAELVVLNSAGGMVHIGLLIADDVHQRGLATFIPEEAGCYSACAYIFLAGIERQVDGELGVHQISSSSSDLVSAQMSISDIIDLLVRFDTPTDVLTAMFRTPPDDMHVFTKAEVAKFGINRSGVDNEIASSERSELEEGGEQVAENAGSPASDDLQDSDASINASLSKLSAIEEYARRPTRMAIFAGLDLFGGDITSMRTDSATECARSCLGMSGQCKAFTFNTDPGAMRGPNCFLKSDQSAPDGNAVAISGQLLSSAERDPEPFSMGTIDPNSALYEDIDLPGGDLSSRPFGGKISAQGCRLACVENKRCIAFTYVKRKKECWLKGAAAGMPRYAEGMVTGLKTTQTFAPASVISLE